MSDEQREEILSNADEGILLKKIRGHKLLKIEYWNQFIITQVNPKSRKFY